MAEITGQVRVANGLVAAGVRFKFFRERFGADPEVLTTDDVATADDGSYTTPDLDVDDKTVLVARMPRDGEPDVVLTPLRPQQALSAMHLVVPTDAMPVASEYRRLKEAVEPVLGGMSLAAARESGDRRDLSLVRRQSGWDARLVAVAALSARLAEPADGNPAAALGEEAVYGLLRSGLPSSAASLAQVPATAVRAALDKSAAAGVIDLDETARADAVAAFETFARDQRLATRPAGGVSTMAELLDATGLSGGDDDSPRARFERVVLDPTSGGSVWQRAADAGLDDATVTTLRTQAKLAFLTTNNAPLMATVAADLQDGDGLAAALVASRFDDAATWTTAIEAAGGAAAVPAGFGADDDPVGSYSAELARRVRVAYPTHVVAAMVERDDLGVGEALRPQVATTLQRAADNGFRIGATHLDSFVVANPTVFDGVDAADRPAVTSALATLHRAYQLSPSNAAMKVLVDHGLTSAYDIVAISEDAFVERFGWLFPSAREARLVHRKSEQVSAVLYNFYSMTKQAAAAPSLPAVSGSVERRERSIANIKRSLPETPTMASLFGSMDYCECDHCRSVLGPAAYLVDLLEFLDPDELTWAGFTADWATRHGGDAYPHGTPYEELMKRRPDLATLALSCDNTNVELPVIDLVNEILEFLVAAPGGVVNSGRESGAVDSADVMAEPEFTIDGAYERLRAAPYPAVLPFDLWHETVREFIGWLGTPLADLLDVFDTGGDDTGRRWAAAIERLGLSGAEADVLIAADPLATWWTRAGFPADATEDDLGSLTTAKQLALRLGVSYQELADLLGTHLVNPGLGELGVLVTAGVSVADAVVWRANRGLVGAAEPVGEPQRSTWLTVRSVQARLDRVTRAYELSGDRAADEWLAALPDDSFASVVVLVDADASCDFDRTIVGSAATGTPLDADQLGDLYVKLDLFQRLRRATGWALADLDAALRAFVPAVAGGAPIFGEPLRTAVVRLSQAVATERLLGTDERDRRRLVSLWSDITTNGPRPLYSELFAQRPVGQQDASLVAPLGDTLSPAAVGGGDAGLARSHVPALQGALGVRADELVAIADRAGAQWATTPLGLAEVSTFHRYAFLADALGWSVADVLTLERLSGIDPFAPLAAEPLAVPTTGPAHPTLAFVRLARRIDESGVTPAELAFLAEHRVVPDGPGAPDEARSGLLGAISNTLGASLAKLAQAALAEGEPPPNTPPPPAPEQVAAAAVAAAIGPRGGLVAALLHGADSLGEPGSGEPPQELVQAFLALADPGADTARAERALLLLDKVLLLAERLDLTAHECRSLGLGTLPLAPVDAPSPAFATVAEAVYHARLRDAIGCPNGALADVVAASRQGDLDAACAALAAATRRPVELVTATAARLGVGVDEIGTAAAIERVWTVLALIERVGVPVETVADWLIIADAATPPATRRRIARDVKDAVRAHLGPIRWREVARPVSDRLRRRQRDALVAAVLPAKGLTSVEELYQDLLIDPGSEPVLRTTRIRQAIASCQLFIQRCLLGIEPGVHPSAINAEQWEWMKRYRVWEANRKIFLYPENWLEPEFRDDKSHLFAELESTLLQSDVTGDVAEDAFLVYLRKLEEIARLDVVGFYIEQDALDPGSTTLHVIGRTHGSPHQYFYRRLQHGIWTPWEPMGVDIEGDHIVPVVWRDRLHVFWVTFLPKSEVSDSEPSGDLLISADSMKLSRFGSDGATGIQVVTGAASKPPPSLAEAKVSDVRRGTSRDGVNRVIEVQLNWSEHLNGSWSPRTSGGFGNVPPHRTTSAFDPASTFVHASVVWADGEEAGVQVHLTGGMTRTFLLRGRNSAPESGTSSSPPRHPYNAARASVNRYFGSGALTVTFAQKFTSVGGAAETPSSSTLGILGSCGGFSVLPAANGITVGAGDIGSLVSPFFFQDAQRTFYVEPSLLETTTETWEEWVVPDPDPGITFDPGILEKHNVVPFVPELVVPVDPDDDDPLFDPWEELYRQRPHDLLTSPDVGVMFGDTVLGARGGLDLTVVSAFEGRRNVTSGIGANGPIDGNVIPVVTGRVRDLSTAATLDDGALAPDRVVLVDTTSLENAGLSASAGGLRVVGRNGLVSTDADIDVSAAVLRNFGLGNLER